MLIRRRSIDIAGVGECYRTDSVSHPSFMVRSSAQNGVVTDDRLLYPIQPWEGGEGRAVLTVALYGHQKVTFVGDRDYWLGPGDFALASEIAPVFFRCQMDARTLHVEWEPGFLGPRPKPGLSRGKLTGAELAALRVAVLAFGTNGYDLLAAAAFVGAVLEQLRSAGVAFDAHADPRSFYHPAAAQLAPVSLAIDRKLILSPGRPLVADLKRDFPRSRWQVTRVITEMSRLLSTPDANWRQVRDGWRSRAAIALLSHETQTIDSVAETLGYSAPHALYRLFSMVGLPPPGRIRAVLRSME